MERQTTFVLAFVTGFVDTVGFITLSGLFIAQITGNLVLVGASLVQADDANTINRLLMLPIYLLGSSLATLLCLLLQKASKAVFPALLMVEAGLLLLFTGLSYFLGTQHHPLGAVDMFFIASAGVLAMAVQSSALRLRFPAYVSTTTMTINLTQFSIDLIDYLVAVPPFVRRPQPQAQQQVLAHQVNRYGVALLGFIVGTGAGALLFAQIGAAATILPVSLVLWMAVVAQRSASAGTVST
ncbi:YoaK family protein [Spirosoma arcticum]